ncbi:MAG: DUF4358 domain-containing protein [Peptococcaceae bacterium]|jgi:hypothetical protein|nr:DUF4358 domain-containing protein [Peptococcaceae bacterium]
MGRKKYFRLFLTFGLVLGLAVIASACGGGQEGKNDAAPVVIDMPAFSSQLQQALGLEAELSPVEEEVFSYVYDVTREDYEQAVLLLSTGATADEICIVKAKDEASKKLLKEKITARVATQKESFSSYLPEEAAKLDNALVKEIDDYLIFVVCGSPEQAEDAISQAIEKISE